MVEVQKRSWWLPHYIVTSIMDIHPQMLKAARITHIVFDLDNTLIGSRANTIPAKYVQHIKKLKSAGFTVFIGSNTRRDITGPIAQLGVVAIVPKGLSFKPRRSFYARATAAANTSPQHIAMVGDHIVHDIIGANRAGYTSVLVQALDSKWAWMRRIFIRFG